MSAVCPVPPLKYLGPCCIMANPDISGIGVRTSIYAQNIIAPILAICAFWDNKVEDKELKRVEEMSISILLTACALLVSALVQARTTGMSTYHALIILNLGWMNNTNAFVYAILWRYKGVRPLKFFSNRTRVLPRGRKAMPIIIGSLHLSFVAGFGLWVWATIDTFGARAQCVTPTPISLHILGHNILVTSSALRKISLTIYALVAFPFLNILLIGGVMYISVDMALRYILPRLPTSWQQQAFFAPGYVWVTILVGSNAAFIVNTETMIGQTNDFVGPGELNWTFGQVLALVLLLLPARDILGITYNSVKQYWKTTTKPPAGQQRTNDSEEDGSTVVSDDRWTSGLSGDIPK